MRNIKNKTYNNLMLVIGKIQKKGYSFEEAREIAEHLFADFQPNKANKVLTMEKLIDRILTKDEYEAEFLSK